MFDLERSIARWRESMSAAGIGPGAVRDELESHLREKFADLVRSGKSEPEAFAAAVEALGRGAALHREFETAMPWHRRMRRLLLQPVDVFPTDFGFVAKCSIACGTVLIGSGFRTTFRAIREVHELDLPLDEIRILWLALSLTLIFCCYFLWIAISYLRNRSFSAAGGLAGTWIILGWFYLNMFTGEYLKLVFDVPALAGQSNRVYGVFFVIWTIVLNRIHAAWRRNLLAAEGATKFPPAPPLTLG
jgi:hypothetical protein